MTYNQHRANVRNYLVGLDIDEVIGWLASQPENSDSWKYGKEFLVELNEEGTYPSE